MPALDFFLRTLAVVVGAVWTFWGWQLYGREKDAVELKLKGLELEAALRPRAPALSESVRIVERNENMTRVRYRGTISNRSAQTFLVPATALSVSVGELPLGPPAPLFKVNAPGEDGSLEWAPFAREEFWRDTLNVPNPWAGRRKSGGATGTLRPGAEYWYEAEFVVQGSATKWLGFKFEICVVPETSSATLPRSQGCNGRSAWLEVTSEINLGDPKS